MIALRNQVCSFEQAQRLFDLGVKIPHFFVWSQKIDTPTRTKVNWFQETPQAYYDPEADPQWKSYPAYTFSEIAKFVPWIVNIPVLYVENRIYYFRIEKLPEEKTEGIWRTGYSRIIHSEGELRYFHIDEDVNLAIALTANLLWLIYKKYITIEQINRR